MRSRRMQRANCRPEMYICDVWHPGRTCLGWRTRVQSKRHWKLPKRMGCTSSPFIRCLPTFELLRRDWSENRKENDYVQHWITRVTRHQCSAACNPPVSQLSGSSNKNVTSHVRLWKTNKGLHPYPPRTLPTAPHLARYPSRSRGSPTKSTHAVPRTLVGTHPPPPTPRHWRPCSHSKPNRPQSNQMGQDRCHNRG